MSIKTRRAARLLFAPLARPSRAPGPLRGSTIHPGCRRQGRCLMDGSQPGIEYSTTILEIDLHNQHVQTRSAFLIAACASSCAVEKSFQTVGTRSASGRRGRRGRSGLAHRAQRAAASCVGEACGIWEAGAAPTLAGLSLTLTRRGPSWLTLVALPSRLTEGASGSLGLGRGYRCLSHS